MDRPKAIDIFLIKNRPMTMTDIEYVIHIHMDAFQGFFLSFLGTAFLRELYSGIIADSSGIAIVSEYNGQIVGFATGTSEPAGFYRRLLTKRWWRFAMASVKPIIKCPSIIPRLIRALSMPSKSSLGVEYGTLLSIATSPKHQKQGVGKSLIRAFLLEAAKRGIKFVNLTTDKVNNEFTNKFYQSMGFIIARSFITPEGREMNEYVKEVSFRYAQFN